MLSSPSYVNFLSSDAPSGQLWTHIMDSVTGDVHPLAAVPVLSVHVNVQLPLSREFHNNAQLSGDLFGLSFYQELENIPVRSELWIWNWKTGELMLVRHNSRLSLY